MKNFRILIVLIIVFAGTGLQGQIYFNHWNPVNSPVTINLNSLIESSNIFAGGNNGTIIKSTNKGLNWMGVNTSITQNIYSLMYSNALYAAGASGLVMRSTDLGNSWIYTNIPSTKDILSLAPFIGSNHLLACGQDGNIYYSTNNAQDWTQVNSGTSNYLYCAVKASSGLYYLCGSGGTFLKLNAYLPLPPSITITSLPTIMSYTWNSMVILSDTNNLLLAGQNGIIMRSTNGGINWTQMQSPTYNSLRKIYKVNDNEIWICGNNGTIIRSTNGGSNWTLQSVNSTANINSLLLSTQTIGIACGTGGTILTSNFISPDTLRKMAFLEGNNIRSTFLTNGVFNQNASMQNTAGFEWPKGSGKTSIFTSGLCISAKVNGNIRQSVAAYSGEFWQGTTNNEIPAIPIQINRIYSVKRGENCNSSVDWANWGYAVNYGAPYVDVNNNGVYDACIDTPGVKNASQTIFMALTDGFASMHTNPSWGGGTTPLYADLRITAWCYSDSALSDVQFIKFDVINKSSQVWNEVYFSLMSDMDLGSAEDDYVGCDSLRNLCYTYNATNNDGLYGQNPPTVGFRILKFPVNKSVIPADTIKTSSYNNQGASPSVPCEQMPANPQQLLNFMKGYKNDLSPWMNPKSSPPNPVKFIYGGNPENNTGWTEFGGSIQNCGGTSGNIIPVNTPGDRRMMINFGKDDFSITPSDSWNQTIVMAQLIARGSNNTNSVTKLKQLSDLAANYYSTVDIKTLNTETPNEYRLEQNYPNPFNSTTIINFSVVKSGYASIKIYDVLGRKIAEPFSGNISAGKYTVNFNASEIPSGIYLYKLEINGYSSSKRMVLIK